MKIYNLKYWSCGNGPEIFPAMRKRSSSLNMCSISGCYGSLSEDSNLSVALKMILISVEIVLLNYLLLQL